MGSSRFHGHGGLESHMVLLYCSCRLRIWIHLSLKAFLLIDSESIALLCRLQHCLS